MFCIQMFPPSTFLQHQTEFLLLSNISLRYKAMVSKLHISAWYFNSWLFLRFNCDVLLQNKPSLFSMDVTTRFARKYISNNVS